MRQQTLPQLSDDQAFGMLRNSLIVAGSELCPDGDHIPVVKDTIHKLARDVENERIDRETDLELKRQLYGILSEAEANLKKLSAGIQKELRPELDEMRSLFDAYFESAKTDQSAFDAIETPPHIKTAQAILEAWEEEQ